MSRHLEEQTTIDLAQMERRTFYRPIFITTDSQFKVEACVALKRSFRLMRQIYVAAVLKSSTPNFNFLSASETGLHGDTNLYAELYVQ